MGKVVRPAGQTDETVVVSARLKKTLVAQIDAIGKETNRTRNSVIEELLTFAVAVDQGVKR